MGELTGELTSEDRNFLVDYCMKPENTWLALAIGEVQPDLKKAIVSSFVKALDESVKNKLERLERLERQWTRTRKTPEMNLERNGDIPIYVMTMEDQGIEIQLLVYKKGAQEDLFVGTPVNNEACNEAWLTELKGLLEERTGLTLGKTASFEWWFKPVINHMSIGSIEALSKLNDDKVRSQKIDYFTTILVKFAEAISEEAEA